MRVGSVRPGGVAQCAVPVGEIFLYQSLREVDIGDTVLLEPDLDAAFDLAEVDLADPTVEGSEFFVRELHEARVECVKALLAFGLAAVHQTAKPVSLPCLDPQAHRRFGDPVRLELSVPDATRDDSVDAPLEGELLGHGAGALVQALAVARAEGKEGFTGLGQLHVSLAVTGEDFQRDLQPEQGVGMGGRVQTAPPRLHRDVDGLNAGVGDGSNGQVVVADGLLLAEHVLHPYAVSLQVDDDVDTRLVRIRAPASSKTPCPVITSPVRVRRNGVRSAR